jgi:hypothetical protein
LQLGAIVIQASFLLVAVIKTIENATIITSLVFGAQLQQLDTD